MLAFFFFFFLSGLSWDLSLIMGQEPVTVVGMSTEEIWYQLVRQMLRVESRVSLNGEEV